MLDKVKNDWGYEDTYLPDVFIVKNVNFDEDNINNEENYIISSLKQSFDAINSNIDEQDEKVTYNSLELLHQDLDDCIERNSNHLNL